MSESQAFFLLSVLCDRLLPGYYSTTMYGTLLDQRVFESLVENTMPILWHHLVKSDVQLSVVSLPWFLSLYINSMPLVFAFRVLDVFFLEGPKVLFQVGLAILRINGEDLLDITDDGMFISILKNYFSRLDESAHPNSENEKYRSVTKFQELLVVAFKEFAGITQSTISEQRAKHKDAVLDNIESFAKRTSIRNLGPDSKRLNPDDLSFVYDRFYGILYEREQRMQMMRENINRRAQASRLPGTELAKGTAGVEVGRVGLGPSPTLMNYDGFRDFLAGIAPWAIKDVPPSSRKASTSEKDGSSFSGHSGRRHSSSAALGAQDAEPADHDFMQRLYGRWNKDDNDGLSLQNVISGLAQIKGTRDIMTSISYFFDLYDDDQDGKVDREGILRISEALLFLTRRGLDGFSTPTSSSTGLGTDGDAPASNPDERFLSSVSGFIRRCFEYADPDHPQNQLNQNKAPADSPLIPGLDSFSIGNDDDDDDDDLVDLGQPSPDPPTPSISPTATSTSLQNSTSANLALDPANPLHITLPTFRMVILADELLQQFFESAFPSSFHLSPTPSAPSTPLTTFSNTAMPAPARVPSTGSRPGGIVPPAKGLRGVLDNIVSDGMRVASEVRKRMDEAQREMERTALNRSGTEEDDEDEESVGRTGANGGYAIDADRRSVRETDLDLLEDAEAIVGAGSTEKNFEDEVPLTSEGSGGDK